MRSLNQVALLGNLTKDPDLKYTPNGNAVINFSIATNREWFDKEAQEKKEAVDFHNVVFWGKAAEIIAQFVSKGKKMYITGRLQTRKWEDKEGRTRYTTEVVGRDFILLTPKGEKAEPVEKKPENGGFGNENVDPSEIPF